MSLLVWALVAMFAGIVLGVLLFPWVASPVGPGLWIGNELFARIFHTIAQVIRGNGVLVKRANNYYEIGLYDDDKDAVYLSDGWHHNLLDADTTRWQLFGKRMFAVTWEPGTDLHQRIARDDAATDGGGYPINMGAAHRYLRGSNDADAISRTEEKAKAEYGGGDSGFSPMVMIVGIIVMILLGIATAFLLV